MFAWACLGFCRSYCRQHSTMSLNLIYVHLCRYKIKEEGTDEDFNVSIYDSGHCRCPVMWFFKTESGVYGKGEYNNRKTNR